MNDFLLRPKRSWKVRRARLQCSCSEGEEQPTTACSYCWEHRHIQAANTKNIFIL